MAEMLLINPRRRKARKARKAPSAAQRRARAAFAAASRRRRNPVAAAPKRRVSRRRNPISASIKRATRRRRNPISLGGGSASYMGMIKAAVVQGAGAVAVDVAFGQINKFLPASMIKIPGTVGVGDAVKAVLTVALGKALNKATRGLSMKAAQGSLTVQARDLIASFVPASMPLGYYASGKVVQGNSRVGPNVRAGMGQYLPPGQTAMLNRYVTPGQTALLNGSGMQRSALVREGVSTFR